MGGEKVKRRNLVTFEVLMCQYEKKKILIRSIHFFLIYYALGNQLDFSHIAFKFAINIEIMLVFSPGFNTFLCSILIVDCNAVSIIPGNLTGT